jgi:hypothetical protein
MAKMPPLLRVGICFFEVRLSESYILDWQIGLQKFFHGFESLLAVR